MTVIDDAQQFRVELAGLDQFQRAYEKMDTRLNYDIVDSATLFCATLEIETRIDGIARGFPGNGMVEHMASQMKDLHRRDLLEQLRGAAGTGHGELEASFA